MISSNKECLECRQNPVLVKTDRLMPLYPYKLWNKELLFLWKIKGCRNYSGFFAAKVNEVLKRFDHSVIVPVPPRPNKIQENGWDQIDELCKFLQFRYGFTIFNVLRRDSEKQQKKLNREERLNNINSVYALKSHEEILKIKKILQNTLPSKVCIIDDVSTTGATVNRCAELLKDLGIKEVEAITLFTV